MAADCRGLRTIATTLNAERVPSPRAREGRHRSWAPSSIRSILFNPLYKGEVIWVRTKKRDAWGRRRQRRAQRDGLDKGIGDRIRVADALALDQLESPLGNGSVVQGLDAEHGVDFGARESLIGRATT